MLKSLVLLPCSLFILSFHSTATLAVAPGKGGPLIPDVARFHRRQTEPTEDGPMSIMDGEIEPAAMSTEEEVTPIMVVRTPPLVTVTDVATITLPSSTVYTTTIVTITPGQLFTNIPTTVTTTETVTTTVYVTGTPPAASSTSPPATGTFVPSTVTATDCATLNQELNGEPYAAPLGHEYNIQCNSFYYTDDDNTISTSYGIESFRACADLCDEEPECNLFFWGTEAAGDQSQECFLLSSDIYGMASDTPIADSGVRVGYVSEAGTTPDQSAEASPTT